MARIAGKTAAQTVKDMRQAATRLIYEHGFEGMNLRMLADAIGMRPGSFYNHIASKQDLLFMLLEATMNELLEKLEHALDGADGPLDALERFVAFHIEFHAKRRQEVFIGNAELRSLTPANLRRIVAMRNAYERRLLEILEAGRAQGVFRVEDTKLAAYGLIAMLTGICTWYRASGRLDVPMLIERYTKMALGCVQARLPEVKAKRLRAPASSTAGARARRHA